MRIIVISDSHHRPENIRIVFERNQSADVFIFLGDGERDFEKIANDYPDKKTLSVSGNCDIGSISPKIDSVFIGDTKIVFTHGHTFSAKYGIGRLLDLAEETKADVMLFGHTHCKHYEYINGIHLLNPGSIGEPRDGYKPSYAFIDVTHNGILCNHVFI